MEEGVVTHLIKFSSREFAGIRLNKKEARAVGLVLGVFLAKQGFERIARTIIKDILLECMEEAVRKLEAYKNFRAMFGE
jgi:hypothetical protein